MLTMLTILLALSIIAGLLFFIGLIIAIIGGSISLILEFFIPCVLIFIGIRLINGGLKKIRGE